MTILDVEEDDRPLSARKAQLKVSASRQNGEGASDERKRQYSLRNHDDRLKPAISQRPLIDQISNKWEGEKRVHLASDDKERGLGLCGLDSENSCPNLTRRTIVSRRFRKMLFYFLLLLGVGLILWSRYVQPRLDEERGFKEGFLLRENGTYGIAKSGDFDGVRIRKLDGGLLPGGDADPEGKRRLIFVGDIHGCARELKDLLRTIEFNEMTDHLIAVGDVISKGPENVEVLGELLRIGASSVRGNHEDRILAMAPQVLQSTLPPPLEESSSKGYAKDAALLRQLSKEHLKFLREMPLVLRVPALPLAAAASHEGKSPLAEEILVVHAGLVPAVALEKQDPYFVMNMRSIQPKTHVPFAEAKDKKGKSKPWHSIWDWYNDRLFRKKSLNGFRVWEEMTTTSVFPGSSKKSGGSWLGSFWDSDKVDAEKLKLRPQVVVYGHHSKAGLQVSRWSKGLDTGCVRGGELTAMILDANGYQDIVSVKCEDHR